MERDKRRMWNNVQNDVFRLGVRAAKVVFYVIFGALVCYVYFLPKPQELASALREVSCKSTVEVEFTGGTTFVIPPSLPNTGAQ